MITFIDIVDCPGESAWGTGPEISAFGFGLKKSLFWTSGQIFAWLVRDHYGFRESCCAPPKNQTHKIFSPISPFLGISRTFVSNHSCLT